MRPLISIIVICILCVSCSPDHTTHTLVNDEITLLNEFQNLDATNRLKITVDDEPGEKLKLCLTIVDRKSKKILKDQKIHFYHTSTVGEYEPKDPNDESTARLNGTAYTDSKGRVYVETILPGDYGSSANNRHIHMSIFGAKPIGYDILFKQFTSKIGENFADYNDQIFIADLKRDEKGDLVTFLTIEPKFP